METPVSPSPHDQSDPSCASCHSGFNYCFWAKFIVGIPALTLIGYAASTFFHSDAAKDIAAVAAVLLSVWLAIKIDHMPLFAGKIVKK